MIKRSTWISARSVTSLALAVVIAAGLTAPPAALADKIILKNGKTIEGKIVEETPEKVRVQLKFGEREVERSEIQEIVREESANDKIEKEIAQAKSADELLKLAERLKGEGQDKFALKALERAIKLAPDHAGARAALAHKKVDGKWLTEREWKLKEGWKEDPKTKELIHPDELAKRQKDAAERATKGAAEEFEGTGEWFVIESKSKRYKIRCNSTQQVAQRYADFMDKIAKEYDKFLVKSRPKHWNGQSVIYIFRNNEDFKAFAAEQRGVGGFYRPFSEDTDTRGPHRLVAAFHGAFGTGDTREVLAHECTHQMEHILCEGDPDPQIDGVTFLVKPTWWMEGYACYFGDGFRFDKKGNLEISIPRMRLNPIQNFLNSEGYKGLPISQFLRIGLQQYQMQAGLTYPYGWSLVYYFSKRGEYSKDKDGKFTPNKGAKKGETAQKPVKITVDGKEREVNLGKVLDDYFTVITKKPPANLAISPSMTMETFEKIPNYYAQKLDELLGFPVDALTEDWKQFILSLEPPTFGKLVGKKFVASEGAFEIEIPGAKGWRWKEDDCVGDEAIRLENPETKALVIVEVDGNMENDDLEKIKENAQSAMQRKFQDWAQERDGSTTLSGHASAHEWVYTGTEQAYMPGQKLREGEQKVWHVLLGGGVETGLKRIHQVICLSDKDRFDENKPAFDKIVASFKILKEN